MEETKNGGRLVDAFATEYRAQLANEPVEVELPLIDPATGQCYRCYVFPLTTIEADRIARAKASGGIEHLIEIVVQRAKDRNGKRLLTDADRVTLRMESLGDTIADASVRIGTARPAPNRESVGKR